MKRMKQVLALLLALVLALSLVPTALADPPQEECREGGEHIWDVYEDTATCTQGGTRMYRCRKCGIWWREPSPALGHDWREGEVIESEGLLGPRRVRYVCDRCYAVKVETEEPSGGEVLNLFRNNLPYQEGEEKLVITLQPVGGSLTNDGDAAHTMTVAAEGGTKPYRYEWHAVDKGVTDYVDGNPVGYAVQSHSRRAAEEANQRRAAFYEQYLNYTREHFGVEDTEGAMRGWTELQIREYGDLELGVYDEPDYTATIGNCSYYCIVRDAHGHEAKSDSAFVGDPLFILLQPIDLTLEEETEYLSCVASGGSGNYTYTWYRSGQGAPLAETGTVVPVKEPGKYYCVVTDGFSERTSITVTVTKPEPANTDKLRIVMQPGGRILNPKTSNHYKATLRCIAALGDEESADIVYIWQRKGASGWVTIQNSHKGKLSLSGTSGKVSGQYRCVVFNPKTGEKVVSRTVRVQVRMACVNVRFKGYSLTGRIIGGVPPYRIEVYQRRPADKDRPRVKTPIKIQIGGNGKFSIPMNPKQYKVYWVTQLIDGHVYKIAHRAYYHIRVVDATGQTVWSATRRYPN